MVHKLSTHFSLSSTELEQKYISGLFEQFDNAVEKDSYHIALFAYHLLFITYFYQVQYKLKIWMPSEHHHAMVSLEGERRRKFREAKSPTDFVHSQNKEASIFEYLNLFGDCELLVGECKKLVKFRNQNLGHASFSLIDLETFEKQIEEYDRCASRICDSYSSCLSLVLDEWLKDYDAEGMSLLLDDEFSLGFVEPNRISNSDLVSILKHCNSKEEESFIVLSTLIVDKFSIDPIYE